MARNTQAELDQLRRDALQIAAQLPSNHEKAMLVLGFAAQIITFINKPERAEAKPCSVVQLPER